MAECHPSKVDVAGSNPVSRLSQETKDERRMKIAFVFRPFITLEYISAEIFHQFILSTVANFYFRRSGNRDATSAPVSAWVFLTLLPDTLRLPS